MDLANWFVHLLLPHMQPDHGQTSQAIDGENNLPECIRIDVHGEASLGIEGLEVGREYAPVRSARQ